MNILSNARGECIQFQGKLGCLKRNFGADTTKSLAKTSLYSKKGGTKAILYCKMIPIKLCTLERNHFTFL